MRKSNLRAFIIGAVILASVTGCGKSATATEEEAIKTASIYSGTIEDSTKNYMSETSYKGDTALDIELFQYPFQTSEDKYVSNKDLIKQLKEEDQTTTTNTTTEGNETSETTAAETEVLSMEDLQESGLTAIGTQKLKNIEAFAKDYVETFLGTGYRTIEDNEDDFISKIENVMVYDTYMDDSGNYYSRNDLVKEVADWMINNHVQADVTFETDDSLVCMNNGKYTVRGTLTIDAYNCDTDEMLDTILNGLDYKNGGKYVFDVTIGNYANTGFCIYGFYVQGV